MSKTNSRSEYYISIDVEMDGPCAGINSMLQLGAAFYKENGIYLNGYSWNIEPLPDAVQDPDTMEWWKKREVEFPGIWARLTANRVTPQRAMTEFASIVLEHNTRLKARPVAVCYPAGYDFSAVYHYLHRFTGDSVLGFSCIDLKTLSMALLNRNYRDHGKKDMPEQWFTPEHPHTHDALTDAIQQGYMFFAMRKDMDKLHSVGIV